MDITSAIYKTLLKGATEISEQVKEYDELYEKIGSNKYSPEAVTEFRQRRDELKKILSRAVDNTMREAKGMVEQYHSEIEDRNTLDPSALNDDLKLLQAGITLTTKDIKNLMDRNRDNRTMQIIIMRYAHENGIDVRGITLSNPLAVEIDLSNRLESTISYFEPWMSKKNAAEILRKYFNVGEEYEKQVLSEIENEKAAAKEKELYARLSAELN